MCEKDTLTVAKRAELAKRLVDNADLIEKNEILNRAVNGAKAQIAHHVAQAGEFGVDDLTADDIEQLRFLFRVTPPPHTSRDFVPWRFLDAGHNSAWKGSSCRRPKTFTETEMACLEQNC
jgi:hypothetical protein